MARENAAERNARLKAERENEILCLQAAYPRRFLEVLKMALNENFELTEVNPETGMFTLYDRDESEKHEIYNNFGNDVEDNHYQLDNVVRAVRFKVDRREEFERQAAVRRNALAKLNPEERAALGL